MKFSRPLVFFLLFLIGLLCVPGLLTASQNGLRLFGRVIDGKSQKGLDYVAISLLAGERDSMIMGMLSQTNGDFSFDNLAPGSYRVKATYEGYAPLIKKVTVSNANPEQDMGNLVMEESAHKMSEVTVTAEKAASNLAVDKKVFNVDKDISSRGGTAMDVMQNIPGVSVDADGGITLRNNTPLIYIDGKPTTLTLDQVPSDQIDRVEVVTNPSAKYEAAASGGVINVIMKHSTKPGYNGMVSILAGTNDQYNGTAMVNFHRNKIGASLSVNASGATNTTKGYDNRIDLDPTTNRPQDFYNQNTLKTNLRRFETIHAGFDYFISNRNTLSISENVVIGKFSNAINADITRLDGFQVGQSTGKNYNYEGVTRNNYTTFLEFKHTYPKKGKEYDITIQYDRQKSVTSFFDSTNSYDLNGNLLAGASGVFKQSIPSGIQSHMVTAQWDFSHPLRDSIKLEYGLRAYYKRTNSFAHTMNYLDSTGVYVSDAALSADFLTHETIDAAYVSVSQQVKKFAYQIGLRFEEDYFIGQLDNNQTFSYHYPTSGSTFYQSFFPSFYLSQRVNDHHLFQLNLTRKTNRPSPGQINPNLEVIDQRDYTKGNAALQPEFINQGEFNYSLTYGPVDWLSSVYARYTEHPITGITSDSSQILLASYTNGKGKFNYGWENTFKFIPVKNFNITLDVNAFYTEIQAYLPEGNQIALLTNKGWSYTAKAIFSYKFPMGFAAQINGSYEAPKPLPQGNTMPVYFFDIAASKEFGPLTLNIGVSDVLNSNIHGTEYYVPYEYIQDLTKRRQTRFAKLSLTYKFGKDDRAGKSKRARKDKEKADESEE